MVVKENPDTKKNKKLFKQNSSKTNVEKQEFLNSLDTKTLTNKQSDLCENEIRKTDLFVSMKSIKNNKTWMIHMDRNFIKGSTLLCYKWSNNYPIL